MENRNSFRLLSILSTLELLLLSNGTGSSARFECPIEITPHRMVVPFKGPAQEATCKPTPAGSPNVKETYWQISQARVDSTKLLINTNEDWDQRPVCTATFEGIPACSKSLDVTIYKTPDSVFIHSVDNVDSVANGTQYQLRCNITKIAPVENLTVRWYQGNETMKINDTLQVTRCPPQYTDCDIKVRAPVDVVSIISITVDKRHNGEEFRCEARLDLGPKGPQPLPMTSNTVNITVFYKPIINATKLPNKVPLIGGYRVDLVCEAEGHPPPKIQWLYSSEKVPHVSGDTLTVLEDGYYTCNATNEVGFSLHEVEVILNEDYLPLIAGFVAVTVVVISVIFVFIYSIYYKNTKMRRYSLKNPKLNTQNGNVAHNGLDLQFPMNKLS